MLVMGATMGLLSDFFVAKPDAVTTYDGGTSFPRELYCQYKGLMPVEVSGILASLRGVPWDAALLDEFPIVHQDSEEGPWTIAIPDDMTDSLASLKESDFGAQATAWSEATREELDWSASDFDPVVRDLVRLARLARETGKSLYLWNCL
jgi:hypothetical protein